MMHREGLRRLGQAALPVLAIASFAGGLTGTIASAGETLGFDFLAYHQAAVRILDGQPLYDMSYTQTGGFGLFYYPPTFLPIILPLGMLSATTATWTWLAILVVAFLVGVSILPTSRAVRWWIVLVAGLSFPFVYGVKLGQVGPILFLLFAMGWRGIDDAFRLGMSGALGAAIKLQPGLLLAWALLTGRHRAVAVGTAGLLLLAAGATGLAGFGAWSDFLTLLRTVSDPITTEHNFTPGSVAYQVGVPAEVASGLQVVSTIAILGISLAAIRWTTDEASYLIAVVASQLVSPILWDHYAMLLLLPIAYLCSAGRWWALAIPLVTAWPLVGVTPPIAYPVAFWLTAVGLLFVGRAARRAEVAA
jgi:alpha-1,2-mannosyltransferase